MADAHRDDTDTPGATAPDHVTLTTGRRVGDAAAATALTDAFQGAGLVVERRTFLPARDDEAHPASVLLLALAGPPLALARLVVPATAPPGVVPALVTALGIGPGPAVAALVAPATLQLKADGVFVSMRVRDRGDLLHALDDLPARIARLGVRGAERRLVYDAGAWHIDP